MPHKKDPITFTYTNWRGTTNVRHVSDIGKPYWGNNEWHPESQWLFEAFDATIGEYRIFALKDCDFTKGEGNVS